MAIRILAAAIGLALAGVARAEDPFAKWEKEIAGIEKRHAETPPKKNGIVFAGSSSIRLWDVQKAFADWSVANCGFGGSLIADSTHFHPRLIKPLAPKEVVFYAGDNDIAAKRTPVQVRDDFRAFAAAVHADVPKCRIHFLSIKPSISRWAQYETQTKANALVKEWIATDKRMNYIDIVPLMLGTDGKPDPKLFKDDGLHASAAGYAKWATAVRAAVK